MPERGAFHEAKDHLLASFERHFLGMVVELCNGNVTEAASRAGVDRKHLRHLMDRRMPSQESWIPDDAFVPYSLDAALRSGQLIDHPDFGKGVVLTADAHRAEVLFKSPARRRTLAHSLQIGESTPRPDLGRSV